MTVARWMGAGSAVPSLVLPDRLMLEEEPGQPAEPRMPCRGCSLHHSMRACSFHHSFHSSSRSHLCLRVRVCACLCVSVCVCAKRGVWVGGRGAVADIEWPISNGRYRMASRHASSSASGVCVLARCVLASGGWPAPYANVCKYSKHSTLNAPVQATSRAGASFLERACRWAHVTGACLMSGA